MPLSIPLKHKTGNTRDFGGWAAYGASGVSKKAHATSLAHYGLIAIIYVLGNWLWLEDRV